MESGGSGRDGGRSARRWRGLAGIGAAIGLLAGGGAGEATDDPNNTTSDSGQVSADAVPAAGASGTPTAAGAAADSGSAGVPRVLVVGTSLTAGLGLDPSDAYPAVLQRKADSAGYAVRIVNAGLSGETSAGLARRMDWLLREPASPQLSGSRSAPAPGPCNLRSSAEPTRRPASLAALLPIRSCSSPVS